MTQADQAGDAASVRLSYHAIRNVTSKEEGENGAATYVVVMNASEILKVGTEGNLRSYIPAHDGKKRSSVHKQIEGTMKNQPDRFIQLNSGFLIGASSIKVDDKNNTVVLGDPSVNNGAQSQGEIRRHFLDATRPEFSIRAEISVEPRPEMRVEIAIARNTTTKIEDISQVGKRGYLDVLDASFTARNPGLRLAKSETDIGDEFIDTNRLLQVLWALMPSELGITGEIPVESRLKSYKAQAGCLREYSKVYQAKDHDDFHAGRFKYFVDMAGEAWIIYNNWKTNPAWNTQRLLEKKKQIKRSDDGDVKEIADGLLFPILGAMSEFVGQDENGTFCMKIPSVFQDEDMMNAARRQLKSVGGSTQAMGRSPGAYEALITLTQMAKRFVSKDTPGERVSAIKPSMRHARDRMLSKTPDAQETFMF